MSDIFISYSSGERNRVLPLVDALKTTGWSVFWDRTIPAGKTWRQVIGSEIRTCRSVLVVWTESSITSEWVLEEAETGKRKQILIPVLLDNVEPPFGFGNIQAANLTAWDGNSSSPNFIRLVADVATILGPAPTPVKEVEERRSWEAGLQRKAEAEYFHQREGQRSVDEARWKTDAESQSQIEEETDRAGLPKRRPIPSGGEPERKESPAAHQHGMEPGVEPLPERPRLGNRRRLYAGGAAVVVIGLAAIAFWWFGLASSKDADVKKIVSLGIQGKRQLDIGEKTLLHVGGKFSDGSETDVRKNLDWYSSETSVVAVNPDGQAEARKDGFADITVRYGGIASPPLTLVVVRGENRSTPGDEARIASKVQEHIQAAGSFRDRGEYSPALAELAKAKSLDPDNKALHDELENTTKACLAEQRIVLTNLRCE